MSEPLSLSDLKKRIKKLNQEVKDLKILIDELEKQRKKAMRNLTEFEEKKREFEKAFGEKE